MHVVGLTGGIGSGKSALASLLASRGVAVIDADVISRRCVEPGGPALAAIVARFGADVLRPDGTLDRAALAGIVFHDGRARADLEAITHPCIRDGIAQDLAAFEGQQEPPALVVLEHPLLVETGGHGRVDTVVVVEAPLTQRLVRLTEQRGMTEDEARARIGVQATDAARRAAADVVVVNDGDLEALRTEADRLLATLLEGTGGAR